MSLYDYEQSKDLDRQDRPFYALIMAAMRRADTGNLERLQAVFPDVWRELQARYHAPGGALTPEEFERLRRRYQATQEGEPTAGDDLVDEDSADDDQVVEEGVDQ